MRKRLTAILLFAAFFVQLMGTGLLYSLQIRALQHAGQERIARGKFDHKEMVILRVASEELRWVKPHEFVYQGFMYDVVTMTDVDGELQIAALKDEREDKVREAFRTHDKEDPIAPRTLSLQTHISPCVITDISMDVYPPENTVALPRQIEQLYLSPYNTISTPPPEA